MAKKREYCQWCKGLLEENGDRWGEIRVSGMRWYRVKSGWTHPGKCFDNQLKRERGLVVVKEGSHV